MLALCAQAQQPVEKEYDDYCVLHTMRCDGLERKYWLYVPDDLPEGAPLIVCMYGFRDSDPQWPAFHGFMELADTEKFVVCIPKQLRDKKKGYGWNVGYCFQQEDEEFTKKVDDVKFLTRLVHHLQKEYKLSKENVFCTGRSNGGEMCYHMAYVKPDLFKAYAPQYGLTMTWLYKQVTPPKAVPLIEIHGTEDGTSAWAGDPVNKGGWGEYLSVPLAVAQFALKARCTHESCEEIPTVNPESKRRVLLHKYLGGNDGVEVWLYEIVGAGHGGFDNEIDTTACIWEFFKKYL